MKRARTCAASQRSRPALSCRLERLDAFGEGAAMTQPKVKARRPRADFERAPDFSEIRSGALPFNASPIWALAVIALALNMFAAMVMFRASISSAIYQGTQTQPVDVYMATLARGADPLEAGCAVHLVSAIARDQWKRSFCQYGLENGWPTAERTRPFAVEAQHMFVEVSK